MRHHLVAVAFAATLCAFAALAGAAHARTIHANWIDRQPLDGGRIVYRTTKIWVHGDRFSVDVAITNRARHDLRFFPATGPDDQVYIPRPGFGLAWRDAPNTGTIHTRRLRTVLPRSFSHTLPLQVDAGKTVHLTFGGRSPVLRTHRSWWLTFGLAVPWQGKRPVGNGDNTYWISDKTFRT